MSQFRLLGTRRFAPLFITQFLGALNDNVYKNAMVIFLAFALADANGIDSNLLIVLAGGVFILPFFLFSATAGQLADKYDKGRLIRHIKLAEIGIMSGGAIAFISESLSLLFIILFLMGAQSSLFGPLKYGILPEHLSLAELTGGNGLVQMGTYIAILGGTIIGGVVIAINGHGPYLITLVVLCFALVGWLVSRYIPAGKPADPAIVIDPNCLRRTWLLLSYCFNHRPLFIAVLGISWFWFLGATFLSLVPGYARDQLGGNEHVATLLLTAFSLGIGTGSLMCERFSHQTIELRLVIAGVFGISLFALDLWLQGTPVIGDGQLTAPAFLQSAAHWRILLDLAGIGLFGGMYIVPLYALVQYRAAADHRARVIAANNILNALLMVASALVTMGLVALGASIPLIFGLIGLGNILFAVLVLTRLGPLRAHLGNLGRWLPSAVE